MNGPTEREQRALKAARVYPPAVNRPNANNSPPEREQRTPSGEAKREARGAAIAAFWAHPQAEALGYRGNAIWAAVMAAVPYFTEPVERFLDEVVEVGREVEQERLDQHHARAAAEARVAVLEQQIAAIEALCYHDGYTTWDVDKHLPGQGWKPDDPKVLAWEAAHGHDPRLKCYPEFGCQLLIDPEDILAVLAAGVVDNPTEETT